MDALRPRWEELLPPPLLDDAVDVVDFPNLQNITQFQEVEELQEEDLLGNAGDQPANNAHAPKQIQIGMIRTVLPEVDPAFFEMLHMKSLLSVLEPGQPAKQPSIVDPFAFDGFTLTNASPKSNMTEANMPTPRPTDFRLWAKYFSNRDPGLPFLTIPAEQMDFFHHDAPQEFL